MNNADMPAFPTENAKQTGVDSYRYEGISKREYFAAMAMQGLCVDGANFPNGTAEMAVDFADELLRQLEEKK